MELYRSLPSLFLVFVYILSLVSAFELTILGYVVTVTGVSPDVASQMSVLASSLNQLGVVDQSTSTTSTSTSNPITTTRSSSTTPNSFSTTDSTAPVTSSYSSANLSASGTSKTISSSLSSSSSAANSSAILSSSKNTASSTLSSFSSSNLAASLATNASSSSSVVSSSISPSASSIPLNYSILATILVIATDSTSSYSATSGLNAHGIPYQLVIVSSSGATLPTLNSTSTVGNFGGIITLNEPSGITVAQWSAMYAYQDAFGVRMVRLNANPAAGADGSSFGVVGANSDSGCCGTNVEQFVYFTNTSAFPTAGLNP
jgi:hypothetical protein